MHQPLAVSMKYDQAVAAGPTAWPEFFDWIHRWNRRFVEMPPLRGAYVGTGISPWSPWFPEHQQQRQGAFWLGTGLAVIPKNDPEASPPGYWRVAVRFWPDPQCWYAEGNSRWKQDPSPCLWLQRGWLSPKEVFDTWGLGLPFTDGQEGPIWFRHRRYREVSASLREAMKAIPKEIRDFVGRFPFGQWQLLRWLAEDPVQRLRRAREVPLWAQVEAFQHAGILRWRCWHRKPHRYPEVLRLLDPESCDPDTCFSAYYRPLRESPGLPGLRGTPLRASLLLRHLAHGRFNISPKLWESLAEHWDPRGEVRIEAALNAMAQEGWDTSRWPRAYINKTLNRYHHTFIPFINRPSEPLWASVALESLDDLRAFGDSLIKARWERHLQAVTNPIHEGWRELCIGRKDTFDSFYDDSGLGRNRFVWRAMQARFGWSEQPQLLCWGLSGDAESPVLACTFGDVGFNPQGYPLPKTHGERCNTLYNYKAPPHLVLPCWD